MSGKDQECRTLWVGDIESWMDEAFVSRCFSQVGNVTNVKMMRRAGSCSAFVEFADAHPVAQLMERLDGRPLFALGFNFRVNWAQHSLGEKETRTLRTDVSLYVGGLDFSVRDSDLLKAFTQRYSSVITAKVILDPHSHLSRGFGFVRLRDQREADQALREMQGVFLGSKQLKVRPATKNQEVREPPSQVSVAGVKALCIGGLDAASIEDCQQLLQRCAAFGAVLRYVFVEASCLVEFQESSAAEAASLHLTGEGLAVSYVELSTVEYYWTLQMEGWLPAVEPAGVAITNLTTAKAEQQLQMQEPGLEHFKALLQDPRFVRLFEQMLQSQGFGTCLSSNARVSDLRAFWLLQDKVELFGRPAAEQVECANADFAAVFGGTGSVPGFVGVPEEMRLGL